MEKKLNVHMEFGMLNIKIVNSSGFMIRKSEMYLSQLCDKALAVPA